MIQIGRVRWPGPVGIGAGLVKNGAMLINFAEHADSVEVGSITRHLREGNIDQGQIIWKYKDERAMRHNAGLPNMGAEKAVKELGDAQYKLEVPWGLNVATTPGLDTAGAVKDIQETVRIMLDGGLRPDWLTLNVSSPDTEDAVEVLGNPERVSALLDTVRPLLQKYGDIPLWVKVAPEMTDEWAKNLCQVLLNKQVEAIITTNTWADPKGRPGGWSGEPLRGKALATIWQVRHFTANKIPIVGTGGVMEGKHVYDKLQMGVSGVQVVTALLMRGREAAEEIRREYELVQVREADAKARGEETATEAVVTAQQANDSSPLPDETNTTGNTAVAAPSQGEQQNQV